MLWQFYIVLLLSFVCVLLGFYFAYTCVQKENITPYVKKQMLQKMWRSFTTIWKRCLMVIAASGLIILCVNCKSTVKTSKIAPPSPFDENGEPIVTYSEETGLVSMPLYYWELIFLYISTTQNQMY